MIEHAYCFCAQIRQLPQEFALINVTRGLIAPSALQCSSCLPVDDLQSQHSLDIGLSFCSVSFPQQLKQRPSSDKIWLAGHRVQSLMLGPWQPSQDGSQALQFGFSLSESWSNNRIQIRLQLQTLVSEFDLRILFLFFHEANVCVDETPLVHKVTQAVCHL